jgi:hypothetical protein
MKKKFMVLLLVLAVINISALATFLYHRLGGNNTAAICPNKGQTCGAVLEETLDLTAAQKQGLEERQALYRQKADSLALALYACRIELSKCLLQEPVAAEELQRIIHTMDSLQSRMNREVVQHLLEQKKFLSPSQQEKFFSMILKQCSFSGKSCCPK